MTPQLTMTKRKTTKTTNTNTTNTNMKMTGETPEVRSDKRKPREKKR